MKNYLSLFAAAVLLSVAFTSCNKDDEKPLAEQIIGHWTLVSEKYSECQDSGDNGTETCSSDCTDALVVTSTTVTSDATTFTYTLSGNTLTVTYATLTFVVTVSVSGNTMTVTGQDEASDGGCKWVETYERG